MCGAGRLSPLEFIVHLLSDVSPPKSSAYTLMPPEGFKVTGQYFVECVSF